MTIKGQIRARSVPVAPLKPLPTSRNQPRQLPRIPAANGDQRAPATPPHPTENRKVTGSMPVGATRVIVTITPETLA